MNEFEVTSAIQLDRFVDGELSEDERREVLLTLNREECNETCGWRRLALAFVESQTLRQELVAICLPPDQRAPGLMRLDTFNTSKFVADAASVHQQIPANSHADAGSVGHDHANLERLTLEFDPASNRAAQAARRSARAGWFRNVALAACCLFAFGIGRWSSPNEDGLARVENRPATAPQTFAGPVEPDGPMALVANENSEESTQQTLRLVLNDLQGGPPQAVDVPVVADAEIDPVELLDSPPAIPVAVQRALLRAGRVVHEQRQLFEVELSDGRRGVVPVSDVTVVNAGLDVYQ